MPQLAIPPAVTTPPPTKGTPAASPAETSSADGNSFAALIQRQVDQMKAGKAAQQPQEPVDPQAAAKNLKALKAALSSAQPDALKEDFPALPEDHPLNALLGALVPVSTSEKSDETRQDAQQIPITDIPAPATAPIAAVTMTPPPAQPIATEAPQETSSAPSAIVEPHLAGDRPQVKPDLPHQAVTAQQAAKRDTGNELPTSSSTPSAILAGIDPRANERSQDTANAHEGSTAFQTLLSNAQAAQGNGQPLHTHAPSAAEAPSMQARVGTLAWHDELGDKLVWMAGKQESRAELVLNPPQMGRIEVSLTLSGDQANAMFISANPAVRDALESAMPRLREVLADAGVQLGQAQVGADSPGYSANSGESGDNSRHSGNRHRASSHSSTDALSANPSPRGAWTSAGQGLVDTFA